MTARVLKAEWSRAMKVIVARRDRRHHVVMSTTIVVLDGNIKEPNAAERPSAAVLYG